MDSGTGVVDLPSSTPKAIGEKGKVVAAYMARPVLVAGAQVEDAEVQAVVEIEGPAEAGVLARAWFDEAYALVVSQGRAILCRYDPLDRTILAERSIAKASAYRVTLVAEPGRITGVVEPRDGGRGASLTFLEKRDLGPGHVGVVANPIGPDPARVRFSSFTASSVEEPKTPKPRLLYAFVGAIGDSSARVSAQSFPPVPLVFESREGSSGETSPIVRGDPREHGNVQVEVPLARSGTRLDIRTDEGETLLPSPFGKQLPGQEDQLAPGDAVTFAFASCTSGRVTAYPSFRAIAERTNRLLHGGDWGYADLTAVHPGPDQFQARWIRLLRAPEVQDFLAEGQLMFWQDDHDYNADNGWSEEIDPMAVTAFDEIHANPSDDYFEVRWGDVHVWCLDCRLHATDPKAPDGPDKSRIGAAQKAWLKQGMTDSDAPVKVVASGMVFRNKPPEDPGWHNDYAYERDELLEFFSSLDATVVIVSGDSHGQRLIHHFEFGELYEFNSSGTDFPGGGQGNHDPEHTLVNDDKSPGFALVELDEAGPDRKLKVSCLSSEDGHELFSKTFPVS